jgi:hypothetical protein
VRLGDLGLAVGGTFAGDFVAVDAC